MAIGASASVTAETIDLAIYKCVYLLAETDMFAIDHTSELHMNANYLRIGRIRPLRPHAGGGEPGDYFISMGEVLLPEVEIAKTSSTMITATAKVRWTFPLAFGEIVWGDGKETFTKTFDLSETGPFGNETFKWTTEAKNWQWARIGALTIHRDQGMGWRGSGCSYKMRLKGMQPHKPSMPLTLLPGDNIVTPIRDHSDRGGTETEVLLGHLCGKAP